MLRRRLGPLGRQAVQVAYECLPELTGVPVVFATRYGDAARSLDLLRDHAAGEAVSPTDFALSVHNAIGAMYSIARRDRVAYTTITAGRASAATAVVEAVGLLDDGASEVLVVCYDAPLPAPYEVFGDEPATSYAWAWRLAKPMPLAPVMRLSTDGGEDAADSDLPFGLDVMRFALSRDSRMTRSAEGVLWTWTRHG